MVVLATDPVLRAIHDPQPGTASHTQSALLFIYSRNICRCGIPWTECQLVTRHTLKGWYKGHAVGCCSMPGGTCGSPGWLIQHGTWTEGDIQKSDSLWHPTSGKRSSRAVIQIGAHIVQDLTGLHHRLGYQYLLWIICMVAS